MHVKCQEISSCTISKGVLLNMPILTDKQILRPYIKKTTGYIKSLLSSQHVEMSNGKTLQATIDEISSNSTLRLINVGGNYNWYYRQWSDGTLEAWRCASESTPINANRPYGSVYYTEDIFWETVDPIVPFQKIETILMGVNKYNNVGLWHVVVRNTDILSNGRVSFSFNLVNPVSISTYASIQVHIIGRWK